MCTSQVLPQLVVCGFESLRPYYGQIVVLPNEGVHVAAYIRRVEVAWWNGLAVIVNIANVAGRPFMRSCWVLLLGFQDHPLLLDQRYKQGCVDINLLAQFVELLLNLVQSQSFLFVWLYLGLGHFFVQDCFLGFLFSFVFDLFQLDFVLLFELLYAKESFLCVLFEEVIDFLLLLLLKLN